MIRYLFLAAMLISAATHSQEAGIGFKSVPLGASLSEFQAAFPDFDCKSSDTCFYSMSYSCIKPGTFANDFECFKRNTWAGMMVSNVSASFKGGRLESVYISIQPSNFAKVLDASKERLGAPVQEIATPIQTRGGVQLQNLTARWESAESVMTLRKYSASIDKGSVNIQTRESYLKEVERAKGDPKAAAKDM